MFFQFVMDSVLGSVGGVRSFLDDLKAQGQDWRECWAVTMRALNALTAAGFMLNLRKCKLLVPSCTLLGCFISASQMALGEKYLRGWLDL